MRKYGKWLLVLGVLAASPAAASADGFLGGKFKPVMPFSGSAEKARNQELANEVAAALKTAQVRGTGIEIEVREGAAILSGSVSDPSQRSLAQRAAGSVPGIERVENNLKYIPPSGSQPMIAQAAHQQSAARQPSMIQQVAAEAPAPAKKSNQEMAAEIAQAIQSCGVACDEMTVRFKDGVCTMEGSVATAADRQALHRAAASVRCHGAWPDDDGCSGCAADCQRICSDQLQQPEPAELRVAGLCGLSELGCSELSDAVQRQCLAVHRTVLPVSAGSDGMARSLPRVGRRILAAQLQQREGQLVLGHESQKLVILRLLQCSRCGC